MIQGGLEEVCDSASDIAVAYRSSHRPPYLSDETVKHRSLTMKCAFSVVIRAMKSRDTQNHSE